MRPMTDQILEKLKGVARALSPRPQLEAAKKSDAASNPAATVVPEETFEPPQTPPQLRPEHVAGARLCADRYELIKSLKVPEHPAVAELGVAFGEFSRFLIEQLHPKLFHAYDIFPFHDFPVIWGRSTAEVFKGLTHRQFYEKQFGAEIASGQMEVFDGDGATNLAERPDGFYDVIYIDGDHRYAWVLRDAKAAAAKLKPGGFLIFNDYILYDHIARTPYGIVPVVNDLCVNHGWKITHFALQQHMFCDVAIRRHE